MDTNTKDVLVDYVEGRRYHATGNINQYEREKVELERHIAYERGYSDACRDVLDKVKELEKKP